MVIGVLGGLFGALFIKVNHIVAYYRKKYFGLKWKKVHEVIGLVFITCTIIYYAPMLLYNDCINEDAGNIDARYIRYLCDKG